MQRCYRQIYKYFISHLKVVKDNKRKYIFFVWDEGQFIKVWKTMKKEKDIKMPVKSYLIWHTSKSLKALTRKLIITYIFITKHNSKYFGKTQSNISLKHNFFTELY